MSKLAGAVACALLGLAATLVNGCSVMPWAGGLSSSRMIVEGNMYKDFAFDFAGKTIGIADFRSSVAWQGGNDLLERSDGVWASDMISTELLFGGFKVLERSHLASLISERRGSTDISIESGTIGKSIQEIGRIWGADLLMVGAVTHFGYNQETAKAAVGVTARLLDVSTGKVCWSFSASRESPTLQEAMYGVALAVKESLVQPHIYVWQEVTE